ncbi:unnamed protein product [Paramecium pentaurelia]|uniref:Uncharacterized protein n=1 Tax=Paramecium pentaurelia TaxID=43138 RepID=A0A8S1YQ43_9CILI|nr:unnamed protein product [Paramecium pentaurelia]
MNGSHKKNEDLSQIFDQIKGVDERIYSLIIWMLGKQNSQGWMEFLSENENLRHLEEQISQSDNSIQEEKESRMDVMRNNIKLILYFIIKIQDHDFNKEDYSDEGCLEQRRDLIKSIRDQMEIIRFLKFLVHLTAYVQLQSVIDAAKSMRYINQFIFKKCYKTNTHSFHFLQDQKMI